MIGFNVRASWSAVVLIAAGGLTLAGCAKDPEVAKREFVRSGDTYVAQHQLAEAIIQYRNAVQQDPKFGAARLKLAAAYMQLGDEANALEEYVKAADLLPDDVDAQIRAGHLLLVARRFDDAQARAERALAVAPDQVDALILRANALAGLRQLDDAVTEMDQAIRANPSSATAYASLGAIQLARGDRGAAEAAFKKAVEASPRTAQTHLALANYYVAVGRKVEAEAELQSALAINPKYLLANRALAYFYVGTGRTAEAEPYLKTVAAVSPDASGKLVLASYYVSQRRPDDARRLLDEVVAAGGDGATAARLQLASLAFAGGDTKVANAHIDAVLTKEPSNTRALAARTELQTAAGQMDAALATARKAVSGDAQSAQAQFALGTVLRLRREDADAATAFAEAVRLNPHLTPARVELARLYLGSGRVTQADQTLQAALSDEPNSPQVQLLGARIQLAQGNTARAEPTVLALQKAFPDSTEVNAIAGLLHLQKKDRPAARAAFTRAIAKEPANVEVLRYLVRMDLQDKQPAAAKARLQAALRAKPDNAEVLLLSSETALATGDSAEAERTTRALIDRDPNNLDAYAALGRIYLANKQVDRAIEQFQALAARQPKSIAINTVVGVLLQMQNRQKDAQVAFERVLQLDPHAAVAANNLAWLYAEQGGNLDLALQLAQTAKAKLPTRPEVNDTLGWVYVKKGLHQLAIAPLEQAVDRDPKNASYQYHLGAAYAAAGDTAKARTALDKAQTLGLSQAEADAARQLAGNLKG